MSNIIAIITALAALATGIANFFMIREMKKQRIATSKPVLKILQKNDVATINKNKHWSWNENESSFSIEPKLMNFGTGPALSIKITWKLDLDKIVNGLKYFDPYNQKKFNHNDNTIELDNSFHAVANQKNTTINAVLVNNASNEPLRIPSYYVTAFEKYIELGFLNKEGEGDYSNYPTFPSIYANFKYEDIHGNELKQEFKILLSFSSISHGEDENEVHTILSIEELNQ